MNFNQLSELEKKMSPDVLQKAAALYEQESLSIKLKMLRTKYGVKQDEVASFTQSAVSKLEKRKDMRISTLIDYLTALGLGLEISTIPNGKNAHKEVLLRVEAV